MEQTPEIAAPRPTGPLPLYVPPSDGGFEGPLPESKKSGENPYERRGVTIIGGDDEEDPREWKGIKADDDL